MNSINMHINLVLFYTVHCSLRILACLRGFEPRTYCLEGSCSIRLSYRHILERVMGIEPTRSAWKAEILPLNYTRICFLMTDL